MNFDMNLVAVFLLLIYGCAVARSESILSDSKGPNNATKPIAPMSWKLEIKNPVLELMNKELEKINQKLGLIVPTGKGKSCADFYKKGFRTDGVYTIDPDGAGSFKVRCDMTTSGGGWTIFQRRLDGSVDFYRGWQDYKNGFGNLKGEFWLGLDKINRLTRSQKNVLRINMEDTTGNTKYAEYSSFAVASEKAKYQLSLGKYSGTAGDSFTYHKGSAFTTKDSDNDRGNGNCAIAYKGAWWYTACHHSNLNGIYHHGKHKSYADGINWYAWKGHYYSLKKVEMKMRPTCFLI